ncbi:hypothetical protein CLV67_103327 [Actinoplanes italicus]|uniref:Uncharacterized protein n=1 Tax=Actinoplanes italicus TaxID=113567 RepID=A0A2T0KJ90_9ACTN|nr:hypothetical protein CLV67_103327 [Actinoplanes italicus]
MFAGLDDIDWGSLGHVSRLNGQFGGAALS